MGDSRIVIPVIVGILILGALGFNHEAFAATIESNGTGGGDWNDNSTWLGGLIPSPTDDVIIKNGDVVTMTDPRQIDSSGNLMIEEGGELIVDGTVGGLFGIVGTVVNSGTITLKGGSGILSGSLINGGTIINEGVITFKGGSGGTSGRFSNVGQVFNNGEIISNGGGIFGGQFFNNGLVENGCNGSITMNGGTGVRSGELFNAATINNSGIMTFNGHRFGSGNGNLNNNGIVTNHNTIIFNPGQATNSGVLLGNPIIQDPISCTVVVGIDIKPGSDPNAIQPFKMGVTPVVILSSSTFSAETVDFSTVTFGPDEATPVHKIPHLEDVNNDGLDDMVLHFKTKEIGIEQNSVELCLMAKTLDGTSIEGCDSIKVVPKT